MEMALVTYRKKFSSCVTKPCSGGRGIDCLSEKAPSWNTFNVDVSAACTQCKIPAKSYE